MDIDAVAASAQEHLRTTGIDGWLLYDYRGMNPIFWDTVGAIDNVTRPCWLWIPAEGGLELLVSYVDQGRFGHLGIPTKLFVSRADMLARLGEMLDGANRVAMEYSPDAALPRVSKVDGGTLELVRGLGVEVVSSADTVQFATQRWSDLQLQSHLVAAGKLTRIVKEAFAYVGDRLQAGPTEYDVAQFIRGRFREEGLEVTDGPVVAANEHASDPHFEPTPHNSVPIRSGDWLLVDLWSRIDGEDSMFADITWTAYVGDRVPPKHQAVFDAVIGGRDAAVDGYRESLRAGARAPGLGGRRSGQGVHLCRGLRRLLQSPPRAQPGPGGPRQRGQPGRLGDPGHQTSHSRCRRHHRTGRLSAQFRSSLGDRRLHHPYRPPYNHRAPARSRENTLAPSLRSA